MADESSQHPIIRRGSCRMRDVHETPSPTNLSSLADKYSVSSSVVEDLYARRRAGARDAELINLLQQKDRGGLDPERARALAAELPQTLISITLIEPPADARRMATVAGLSCPPLAAEVPGPQRSDPLSHLGNMFSALGPYRRKPGPFEIRTDVSCQQLQVGDELLLNAPFAFVHLSRTAGCVWKYRGRGRRVRQPGSRRSRS